MLALAAAVALSACSSGSAVAKPGDPAPPIAGPTIDGSQLDLRSLRGRPVIVNFWASWCVPCGDEAPILKRVQASLAKSGAGTVLGVTNNDAPDGSREFLRKHGLRFPNVRDVGTKLWHDFGATGVPETFVLDARGRVVAIDHGQMANDEFLNNAIAKAKGAPA